MPVMPRLADVKCSRIRFEPGDRVLVRSYHRLALDQEKRLKKAIQRWAGCEIEVLVYCATDLDVQVEKKVLSRTASL